MKGTYAGKLILQTTYFLSKAFRFDYIADFPKLVLGDVNKV